MLCEIDRLSLSKVHKLLHPSISQFNNRLPVEAMQNAFAAIRQISPEEQSSNDWLILGTLAQTCGLSTRCRAAYHVGHRLFPNDARLAALYAWELSAAGQDRRCKRVLKNAKPVTDAEKAMLHSVACYNHSINRWGRTALKYHDSALELAEDDIVVRYVLSRAAGKRTDWELAIQLGTSVVDTHPQWARAKAALFDSLMCVGKTDAATELVVADQTSQRHVWLDFSTATNLEISHQFDKAIVHLDKMVNYYPPNSKTMKFCQRQLALLLMKNNRIDKARELTQRFSIEGFEEWVNLIDEDPRKAYVAMPMVAQTQYHCVPTVSAMVATAQGFKISPQELAEAMDTHNGTPMWKMVDAMKALGFRVVCVKPTEEIVEKMLEQGTPLIGELSGVFGGHVDVVCGFDVALKMFHMRDPMHWYGFSISYETIQKRYEKSRSLWALIAPERIAKVDVPPEWENIEAQAMIDMSRAIAQGQREIAEEKFSLVSDDHPLSFLRDSAARNVVLTSRQADKRAKQEVDSISADSEITLSQVQSMLATMDRHNADQIYKIAKANQKRLGHSWVKYVYSQGLVASMKWGEAERHLTKMTQVWPSTESLWSQLAMVKEELGKSDEAERCLDIALQITPERDYFQTKSVEQLKLKIPFREQLERQLEIESRFPYSPELKIARATLMADHVDGLENEKALRECIRYYPRNQWAYQQLSDWYLGQRRKDFAAACLKEGRALVGEQDLPTSDWETEYWKEIGVTDAIGTPASEPPESEAEIQLDHFQSLYSVLYDKVGELPYEEFRKLPELEELNETDRLRKFSWRQSTTILSIQIRSLLFDQSKEFVTESTARVEALRKLLPTKPPGIPEAFTEAVLQQVTLEYSTKRIIQVVYDWIEKVTPHADRYPNLVFQKAYMLEQMLKLTEAEAMLQELVANHPCFVSGWYRIGQLQTQRTDYQAAWDTFKKCLAIQPGHFGAMDQLKRLAEHIGSDESKKYAAMLARMLPYDNSYLYDSAFYLKQGEDCAPAVAELEKSRSRIGESAYAIIRGRIYCDAGQNESALATIEEANVAPMDQHQADWICIDSLVQLKRFKEAETYLARLEEKNPEDQSVIDQRIRLLRIDDPQAASQYASKKIRAGYGMSILAYVELQNERAPAKHAIEVLEAIEVIDHRDRAAEAYYEALNELKGSSRQRLRFLEYCDKHLPHLTSLRRAYVYELGTNQNHKKAIKIARALHAFEPENPQWLGLLGWAVQDKNPKESILLLKQELAMTDSVETLAQIARGYQLAGNHTEALETYEQVVSRNPNHAVALTNMIVRYKQSDHRMLDLVKDTISKSMVGPSDQYFLVQAVKLAKQHGAQLPTQWIGLALDRLQRLQVEAPFDDEKILLRRAICIWQENWNTPSADYKFGIVEKQFSKYIWPGQKWIPTNPA